jgi:hypothetical protein
VFFWQFRDDAFLINFWPDFFPLAQFETHSHVRDLMVVTNVLFP